MTTIQTDLGKGSSLMSFFETKGLFVYAAIGLLLNSVGLTLSIQAGWVLGILINSCGVVASIVLGLLMWTTPR